MNHRPVLDTTNVPPSSRYSFDETPIEMSPSDSLTRGNAGLGVSNQGIPQAPSPPSTHQPASGSGLPSPVPAEERVRSPIHEPPVHPAYFAPYADETPLQSPASIHFQPPPSPYRSQPNSPGPLPMKINLSEPSQSPVRTVAIAPDENPLKSPLTPKSGKPTAWPSPPNAQSARDSFPNHLPGQVVHENAMVEGGHWSAGLCSLSDIGACCLGFTCPCILYGKTQYRLSRKSKQEDPTNMLGFELCNASCVMMACLCGLQCLLGTIQHTRVRKAYKIEGDVCSDCVRATCCLCCTLVQDEREIKRREKARYDAAQALSSPTVSPYIPPPTMTFPPPPSSHR